MVLFMYLITNFSSGCPSTAPLLIFTIPVSPLFLSSSALFDILYLRTVAFR